MTRNETNGKAIATAEDRALTASEIAIDRALERIERFLDRWIVTPLLGKGEAND